MAVFIDTTEAQMWEKVDSIFPPGDTVGQIARITFTDKHIGWLFSVFQRDVANGNFYKAIYKTTNGGTNWESNRIEINRDFYIPTIFSREPDYFMAICQSITDSIARTLLSSNGGEAWESSILSKQTIPSYDHISKVWFFNDTDGIAFNNYRWLTTNAGYAWKKGGDTVTAFPSPTDVHFWNDRLGWMVSDNSYYATDAGYIANTTDGGKTWKYYDTLFTPPMYAVDFIDSLKGFVVGNNYQFTTGFIYSTIDGGENWTWRQFFTTGPFWDIGFLDEKHGWITGSGKILRTTDGGETWETQVQGLQSELRKLIVLKTDKVAYVFGDDDNGTHTLLHADLSNITELEEHKKGLPESLHLAQNYPNPFNPTTTIRFRIHDSGFTTLKVFDLLGREVLTLINEQLPPGTYERILDARELASGTYFYRLSVPDPPAHYGQVSVETKRLLLLK
jgi:photosystem II stability/assembly factor-like uncharacterized protein